MPRLILRFSYQAIPLPAPSLWTYIGLFGVLLILGGCNRTDLSTIPTRAQVGAAPKVIMATPTVKMVTIPATFTAAAQDLPSAGIITHTPTPEPPPATSTSIPSPTPAVIPIGALPRFDPSYLETPPETTPCKDRGTTFRSRFPSKVGGRWRSYHVYLPPCYGQDGHVYPVIFLIHGSIQTDSHWLDLGLAHYADTGIASGRYPPFIAIMPASGTLGNISSGGPNSIEGITVDYLLPFVDREFCSWNTSAGRTIGGISRGGYWALEIAFSHTNLFSAVSGHSSHLRFETDPAKYNPLAIYASVDLSQMRIWLDRGEKDFLRTGQEQLHENLSSAQIPHEYRVNPGGHNDAYWANHIAEYLDWHTALWPKDRNALPLCN